MTFEWSEQKNRLLKGSRGISFEEIVLCLQEGKLLTVLEHPNPARFPNQRLYLVATRGQVFVVPFVVNESEEVVFLKMIYPSRKYTRRYLEDPDERTAE